jgi:uncharacterized membrane protein
MSATIAIHLAAALVALPLGLVMLARAKGTPSHKRLGRVWVGVMAVAAASSFGIEAISRDAGYSWIHALSVWTLFALTMGVLAIRRGNRRWHRGWMIGTFAGLVIAGLLALAPGRTVGRFLFG